MEQKEKEEKEYVGQKTSDFQIISELGRGSYGTVFRVVSQITGKEYVMKKINIKHMKPKHQKEALKEAQILRKIKNNNIIKYYTSFIDKEVLYIIMEFAENGDLQQAIKEKRSKKQHFTEQEIWDLAWTLVHSVDYLHRNNIIHRDIKTLNIFIMADKRTKLGDLGVSKIVSSQMAQQATVVGTPLYLAPELVQQQPYDFKVDIWAIGCVLYHVAALEPPFQGDNLITLGFNIVHKNPKPLPGLYSGKLVNLIHKFLEKNPNNRQSTKDILERFPNKSAFITQEKYEQNAKNVLINNNQKSKRNQLQSYQGRIDIFDKQSAKNLLSSENGNNNSKREEKISEKRQKLFSQNQPRVKNDYHNINLKMKENNYVYDVLNKNGDQTDEGGLKGIKEKKLENFKPKLNYVQLDQEKPKVQNLSKELEEEYKKTKDQIDKLNKEKLINFDVIPQKQNNHSNRPSSSGGMKKRTPKQQPIKYQNSSQHEYINYIDNTSSQNKGNDQKQRPGTQIVGSREKAKENNFFSRETTKLQEHQQKSHREDDKLSPKNNNYFENNRKSEKNISQQEDMSKKSKGDEETLKKQQQQQQQQELKVVSKNEVEQKESAYQRYKQKGMTQVQSPKHSTTQNQEKIPSTSQIESYYNKNSGTKEKDFYNNVNQFNSNYKIRPYSAQIKSKPYMMSGVQREPKNRDQEIEKIENMVQNFKKINEEYLNRDISKNNSKENLKFISSQNENGEKYNLVYKQPQTTVNKNRNNLSSNSGFSKKDFPDISGKIQKEEADLKRSKRKEMKISSQSNREKSPKNSQNLYESFEQKFQHMQNLKQKQSQQAQQFYSKHNSKQSSNNQDNNSSNNNNNVQKHSHTKHSVRPKSANVAGYYSGGGGFLNRKVGGANNKGHQGPLFQSPFTQSEHSHKKIVTNYLKNTIGKMTLHQEHFSGQDNNKLLMVNKRLSGIEPIKEVDELKVQNSNYQKGNSSSPHNEYQMNQDKFGQNSNSNKNINQKIGFLSRPQTANPQSNRKKITLKDLINY